MLPRFSRAVPAVLVAVVDATVATAIFDFDLDTVGSLPGGLPTPTLPWTDHGDFVPLLIAALSGGVVVGRQRRGSSFWASSKASCLRS